MTGTDRIGITKPTPTTSFYLSADQISQSIGDNSSVVRCYIRAVNSGNTTSHDNDPGSQIGAIDGVGTFRNHSSTPFLPSGYGSGALRWEDGPYDVTVPHNTDGTRSITLRMILSYGGIYQELTAAMDLTTIPRIPYAFLRWTGAAEAHAVTAVRWDGTNEVPLTTAVRWNGTTEESLL